MLDRLTDRGLVKRRQVDQDRLLTLVCLTVEGEHAQAEIRQLWATVCRQVTAGMQGDPSAMVLQLGSLSDRLSARLMKLR
ncbi:hypothetical protein Sa4125_21570 [Aureimonas sp. SA4125]|nr:hypothetical protein Sa4125_21570 [Aureimonas sp. SA4125]